jgi:nitrate reductase assembly molybdenum cofactor insertion protein NarJ
MMKLKEATEQKSIYSAFADVLKYPNEDISGLIQECIDALLNDPSYSPEVVEELRKFQQSASDMPLDDLQGIYTHTFEFSADQTLDLGHHLFEGFKRANNLVDIKEMYKAHGFPYDYIAKGELPDNLPVVLQFLSMVKDEHTKKGFREGFLIKALEKLGKNFEKIQDNIYRPVVAALIMVVDKDVKGA